MGKTANELNALTEGIIGCCIEVHRELGPGLLESVYEECLCVALEDIGLKYDRQGMVPIKFRDMVLDVPFRNDILVEQAVILELKAVDQITGLHQAQLLTYLKLTGHPLGLLCNFNVPIFTKGLKRLVNPACAVDLHLT